MTTPSTAATRGSPPLPAIEIPPNLALPATTSPILAALFADYARVSVEGEFGGGFSGARVLKVTPYRDADTPELPTVVKVGPADLIRQEYAAYRRYIRGRLSGIPEVWGEPVYAAMGVDGVDEVDRVDGADGDIGGLRYALVGAGLFEFISLARYAETAAPEDLAHVLESRVFVHLGTIWRQSRVVADAPLGAAYTDLLEPNRTDYFAAALARTAASALAPELAATAMVAPDQPAMLLPNPLAILPSLLRAPIPHRVATIHGDLNLENILVDPAARTVRLIDFSHSREDHVLHDLLRLETGLITRILPAKLAKAGLDKSAVVDLYRRLHSGADEGPPDPALRTAYIGLAAIRKAAVPLLADPTDWREYLVGLAAYLIGAGKYRNLDAPAKATAFWAAAAALDLAERQPAANLEALERAIPVLLERNPALDAYRRGRIAEWAGPRYELDERFVELSLLVDQGEESASGRWQAKDKRYNSLASLLGEVTDPALVILGAPGSGKSTLLRRLELELALVGLDAPDAPLTFFLPLGQYKSARPGEPPPAPRPWLAAQWSLRNPRLPPLATLLADGRLILLLDALNEMPAASAADARARVGVWKDFAQEIAATAPGSRVIFSCRSLDYSTPLSTPALRVPQVRVEPLEDAQVRRFLDQYLPNHAEGLWATLVESGHLNVVRSPYFLKLLVEQVEASGDVPLGRAALFTGFVRQALRREVERDHPLFQPEDGTHGRAPLLTERDVHRLTAARPWRTPYELPERGVLVPKLAELAYRMQAHSEAEGEAAQVRVDFDTALELLAHARDADIVAAGAALGVLDEDPGRDEVLFVHQLVQEYFAARELAKAPEPELVRALWRAAEIRPSVRELIDTLPPAEELPPLPRTGWEETAQLAATMTADAEGYIRRLMTANLALAGRCAAQAELRQLLGAGARRAGTPHAGLLDGLRWALVARSRDPEADLRDRIACGLAAGALGDPRFDRREGPCGEYLLPPLVEVPGGSYPVGSDQTYETRGMLIDDHCPQHVVTLGRFAIGRFPVTNAEWACFVAARAYDDEQWWDTPNALRWRNGEGTADGVRQNQRLWWQRFREQPEWLERLIADGVLPTAIGDRWRLWCLLDEAAFEEELMTHWPASRLTQPARWADRAFNQPGQPVVGICWYEARAYCNWLSAQTGLPFRLPTEVEWEAAARGPGGWHYAYGDDFDPLRGNSFETHLRRTTPVGVFPGGDTLLEVSDMTGNSQDWTSTAYGRDHNAPEYRYPYDARDGREAAEAPSTMQRVIRGGTCMFHQQNSRAMNRNNDLPDFRNDLTGLRVVTSVADGA